jgi:hypothetical protein
MGHVPMSVQVLMRCCVQGMNPGRRLPNGTEEVVNASGVTLSASGRAYGEHGA